MSVLSTETNSFVKLLFEVLSSGEYDTDIQAAAAASVSHVTPIIPVTGVSTTNGGGSGVSSHGDLDLRSSRPGAVVQPLVSGNSSVAEDKDYRHGDVYRPAPAHDIHQQSEHRRDWRRRSPPRTVR